VETDNDGAWVGRARGDAQTDDSTVSTVNPINVQTEVDVVGFPAMHAVISGVRAPLTAVDARRRAREGPAVFAPSAAATRRCGGGLRSASLAFRRRTGSLLPPLRGRCVRARRR
jgi:hypothetical protein